MNFTRLSQQVVPGSLWKEWGPLKSMSVEKGNLKTKSLKTSKKDILKENLDQKGKEGEFGKNAFWRRPVVST